MNTEIKGLIVNYLSIEENNFGGNLHSILEDGNVSDSSLLCCFQECEISNDYLGMLICSKLYNIDECEREEAINTQDCGIEPNIYDCLFYTNLIDV